MQLTIQEGCLQAKRRAASLRRIRTCKAQQVVRRMPQAERSIHCWWKGIWSGTCTTLAGADLFPLEAAYMCKLHLTLLFLAIGKMLAVTPENVASPTAPVQMTLTVEARHDKEVPVLNKEDVVVFQRKERLPVTSFVPCQGEQAALELFILIDDASDMSLGSQLGDLRQFIETQPPTTSIGIGYMRNGTVQVERNLTADHPGAAKNLRLPLGYPGVMPSPFLALSDLIKRWPASAARREVILVTSGVDPLGGAQSDPYLDAASENAQRAGIIVYTVYTPSAGHSGHSYWRMNWGQNHLAQIAEETGGESYMLGFGPPVSFAPYLADIAEHLAHQYVVTFLITPGKKSGFQSVRFTTEVPNAELVAAGRVYVPAGH